MPLPDLKSPINIRALAYWQEKRGARCMPARGDIDPVEIVDILPHVILFEVERNPPDFYYRLLGTKMDEHMNGSYTGMRMSEIAHQRPPSRIWTCLETVRDSKEPLSSDIPYVGKNKDFLVSEDLIMPLSDDGDQVNMILVTVGFI